MDLPNHDIRKHKKNCKVGLPLCNVHAVRLNVASYFALVASIVPLLKISSIMLLTSKYLQI